MIGDVLHQIAVVIGVIAGSLLAAWLLVLAAIIAVWAIVRRRWARDARNLEHVRPLADPAEEQTFADIAEQLLDDGLADVCEDLGWME